MSLWCDTKVWTLPERALSLTYVQVGHIIFNFMMRTCLCASLGLEDVGRRVILCGWVFRRRDHGGLIFLDLRDISGIVQVVFSPEISEEAHEKASNVRQEYVLSIKGLVSRRPEGTENPNLKTGNIEVLADSIEILNTCKSLPFQLEDDEPNESIRLKYRYLDMRRPSVQAIFIKRSKALRVVREYLIEQGFLEIETPFLTKSTPEGARDFIVPSRLNPGTFYALPQSPQIFKQIFMVAGFDRYFQIVRCFRDEDLRADRQPEFTQIDLEMSFVDEEDIIRISEGLMKVLFEELTERHIEIPFPRMTYDQAMQLYGTDKPDLRFDLPLIDLRCMFENTQFSIFRDALKNKGSIKGLLLKDKILSRKDLDTTVDVAKNLGAKGLIWIRKEGEKLHSPLVKYLIDKEREFLEKNLKMEENDTLFIMAGEARNVEEIMGRLRLYLAERHSLINNGDLKFLWVIDFPLFEYSEEEKRYVARHHPFTASKFEIKRFDGDYERAKAKAYDLVLNGVELGGGSIRNHKAEDQREMFRLLKIEEKEFNEKFGFLLEALEMGAPPHGGIAFGFDRILAMALGLESIRDVIPFPKTQKGICLLTNAPSKVENKQLKELKINVITQEKEY